MSVPKLFGVSAAATAQAEALMSRDLKIPAEGTWPTSTSTDKNGVTRIRWAEQGVIETAFIRLTKSGLTELAVGVKLRPGQPNGNRFGWAGFMFNLAVHAKTEAGLSLTEQESKHAFMNSKSIAGVIGLLKATGFYPVDGDGSLSEELLSAIFMPVKEQGNNTPLRGKEVFANVLAEPDKRDGKMRTRIESFTVSE